MERSIRSIQRRFTNLCIAVTVLFGGLFVGLLVLAALTVCAKEPTQLPAGGSVIKSENDPREPVRNSPAIEHGTSSTQVVLASQRFVHW